MTKIAWWSTTLLIWAPGLWANSLPAPTFSVSAVTQTLGSPISCSIAIAGTCILGGSGATSATLVTGPQLTETAHAQVFGGDTTSDADATARPRGR